MRLEVFRCQSCMGIALVDAERQPLNTDLPCPYCLNHPNRDMSEMVPVPRTLRYPDDFASTVRIVKED